MASNGEQQQNPTARPWLWRSFGGGLVLANQRAHIVMDFVRKGMRGAEPRFGRRSDNMGGLMVPLSQWESMPPDAEFMLRAVNTHDALLAACKAALEARVEYNGPCDHEPQYGEDCLQCELRKAIALAEKES